MLFLNNKKSIKRVFIVDLQANIQPSHGFGFFFPSRKYKSMQLVITVGNSFPNWLDFFVWLRGSQNACIYLTYHQHCNQNEKQKAPSVIHCSDLSEPLRFNAGKKVPAFHPKAYTGKGVWSFRASNRARGAEKVNSRRTHKQDLPLRMFCLLVLFFVQINVKARLISL